MVVEDVAVGMQVVKVEHQEGRSVFSGSNGLNSNVVDELSMPFFNTFLSPP